MDLENKTTKLERKVEIAEMVEKVRDGFKRQEEGHRRRCSCFNTSKKYYEISQKHIEITEHTCYSVDRFWGIGELMLWIIIWKIGLELKRLPVIWT